MMAHLGSKLQVCAAATGGGLLICYAYWRLCRTTQSSVRANGAGNGSDDERDRRFEQQLEALRREVTELRAALTRVQGRVRRPLHESLQDALSSARGRTRSQPRIFLCSVLSDTREEREAVSRQVVPALRATCEMHGMQLSVYDVRWGITAQAKQQRLAVCSCLQMVDASSIFVAILGERDATAVADHKFLSECVDVAAQAYPWVATRRSDSLVALEIRHAALNDPAAALVRGNCFFYFRQPPNAASATDDGLDQHNNELLTSMQALKHEIKAAGLRTAQYQGPAQLAQTLVRDVGNHITRTCGTADATQGMDSGNDAATGAAAEGERPVGARRRRPRHWPRQKQLFSSSHLAFAERHAQQYVGDKHYERVLRYFSMRGTGVGVQSGSQARRLPLVITSEPGMGKSALLSVWWLARQQEQPGDLFLTHFCGSSAASSSATRLLERFTAALRQRLEHVLVTSPAARSNSARALLDIDADGRGGGGRDPGDVAADGVTADSAASHVSTVSADARAAVLQSAHRKRQQFVPTERSEVVRSFNAALAMVAAKIAPNKVHIIIDGVESLAPKTLEPALTERGANLSAAYASAINGSAPGAASTALAAGAALNPAQSTGTYGAAAGAPVATRLPDWLPPVFPDGVEVLLSIDRSHPWMRLAMLRRWPSIEVERVGSRSERYDLIRAFLDAAGKDLSDADRERLLSHPMSCNPLFLRLLVDELCASAVYESLGSRLDELLRSNSIVALLHCIMQRIESEYAVSVHGPHARYLVCDFFCQLLISRRGLTEEEAKLCLTRMVDARARAAANGSLADSVLLPDETWARLFLDVKQFLLFGEEGFNFANPNFADFVRRYYLSGAAVEARLHCTAADTFESLARAAGSDARMMLAPRDSFLRRDSGGQPEPIGGRLGRFIFEVPFHLSVAIRLQVSSPQSNGRTGAKALPFDVDVEDLKTRLRSHLLKPYCFQQLWQTARYDLFSYWRLLGAPDDALRGASVEYVRLFESVRARGTGEVGTSMLPLLAEDVIGFVREAACFRTACPVAKWLLEHRVQERARLSNAAPSKKIALAELAVGRAALLLGSLLARAGHWGDAETHSARALTIFEQQLPARHFFIARACRKLGVVLRRQSRYAEAKQMLCRAIEIVSGAEVEGVNAADAMCFLADVKASLGVLQTITKDTTVAEGTFEDVMKLTVLAHGPKHIEVAKVLSQRAELRLACDKLKLALNDLHTSLQIKLECCGHGHIECAYTFVALARVHQKLGELPQMVGCSQEACNIRMRSLGRDHPRTREAAWLHVEALRLVGRDADAEQLCARFLGDGWFSSVEQVRAKLLQHGVAMNEAQSAMLLAEVQTGKARLEFSDDDGVGCRRVVTVVKVRIIRDGAELREMPRAGAERPNVIDSAGQRTRSSLDSQTVLPRDESSTGMTARDKAWNERMLATKLLPTEDAFQGAMRAIQCELGLGAHEVHRAELHKHTRVKWEEQRPSTRYPGLWTAYTLVQLDASVSGLPASDTFQTFEQAKGVTHTWEWVSTAASALATATLPT